ncbi:peptidase S8/S53 domain-containing protein [Multifurca ochricompacta]|uniref:Peptidase S8/S53 domain-containing protein n=1 Tax=Multifurca ochricompacta TaxID=376703 RepID=A0AAD4M0C2_9AGAM|nr:peptidase S8/S53 domain-containing protein [Multifurca ochricompacta]
MFKKGLSPVAMGNHLNFLQSAHSEDPLLERDNGLRHVFDSYIKGYAGKFTENVIDKIRGMPEVDYGLARISHHPKLTHGTFTKYEHQPSGGEGVDVYVIDTGINIHHKDFEGRASWGKTTPVNDIDEDVNGHGTHCAGTIASRKYGVAKSANVIAVKVVGPDGKGSNSDVTSGVIFAAESAALKAKEAEEEIKATGTTKHKGSVANMSLGGGRSRSLDDVVNGAVDTGLHFAVVAGNNDRDACSYSPAAAVKAITVAASTLSDERAWFSNHGPCVDVFAPGQDIMSTWIGSDSAENIISGTSMASPHVAGLLAYHLSTLPSTKFNPLSSSIVPPTAQWASGFVPPSKLAHLFKSPTPSDLKATVIKHSSRGLLSEVDLNTPNLLVFNNYTNFF